MRRRIHANKAGVAMLGVQMPRDLKAALDKVADRQETPTSVLVRRVLRGCLESRRKAEDTEAAR